MLENSRGVQRSMRLGVGLEQYCFSILYLILNSGSKIWALLRYTIDKSIVLCDFWWNGQRWRLVSNWWNFKPWSFQWLRWDVEYLPYVSKILTEVDYDVETEYIKILHQGPVIGREQDMLESNACWLIYTTYHHLASSYLKTRNASSGTPVLLLRVI